MSKKLEFQEQFYVKTSKNFVLKNPKLCLKKISCQKIQNFVLRKTKNFVLKNSC